MKWIILVFLLSSIQLASAVSERIVDENIKILALDMCRAMIPGPGAPPVVEGVKINVIDHIKKHENIANPSNQQIVLFLNKHRDDLVCNIAGHKDHYMKFAIYRRHHTNIFEKLFIDHLMEDQDMMVDVNAISLNANNQPETVVDYIDHLLEINYFESATATTVKSVRRMLIEDFGGKKYEDLSDDEKSGFTN